MVKKAKVPREKIKVRINEGKTAKSKAKPRYSFDKYMAATDPYFLSLVDPFTYTAAKIPDLEPHPSSTFQIVKRLNLSVNSNGVCGIMLGTTGLLSAVARGSLVPVRVGNSPATNYGEIGMTLSNTATNSSLGLGATTSDFVRLDNFAWLADFPVGVPEYFNQVRLVSAGMTCDYTGTALNSAGTFTIAQAPRDTLRDDWGVGVDITRIQNLPEAVISPVNSLQGASVFYRPVDNVSLQYTDVKDIQYDASTALRTKDFEAAKGNELYIIGTGLTSGDGAVVNIVLNYEAIPVYSNFNLFSTSPSPSDVNQLSHTMQQVQRIPASAQGSGQSKGLMEGAPERISHHNVDESGRYALATNAKHLLDYSNKSRAINANKSFIERAIDWGKGAVNDVGPIVQAATPLIEGALALL